MEAGPWTWPLSWPVGARRRIPRPGARRHRRHARHIPSICPGPRPGSARCPRGRCRGPPPSRRAWPCRLPRHVPPRGAGNAIARRPGACRLRHGRRLPRPPMGRQYPGGHRRRSCRRSRTRWRVPAHRRRRITPGARPAARGRYGPGTGNRRRAFPPSGTARPAPATALRPATAGAWAR